MLVFPNIMATDYVGPADLLARIPGAKVRLIWKHKDAIHTDLGWDIRATDNFESCGQLDMIVVPGGPGIGDLLTDEETLALLKLLTKISENDRYPLSPRIRLLRI